MNFWATSGVFSTQEGNSALKHIFFCDSLLVEPTTSKRIVLKQQYFVTIGVPNADGRGIWKSFVVVRALTAGRPQASSPRGITWYLLWHVAIPHIECNFDCYSTLCNDVNNVHGFLDSVVTAPWNQHSNTVLKRINNDFPCYRDYVS